MQEETVSITLWGNLERCDKWTEWYTDVKKIFDLLGFDITHWGIRSLKRQMPKVAKIPRKEEKIFERLRKEENLQALSCYSLPKDYQNASFDYDLLIVKNEKYISVIMNGSDYSVERGEIIKMILCQYTQEFRGQIYKMNKQEVPLTYAADNNSSIVCPSLEIIDSF